MRSMVEGAIGDGGRGRGTMRSMVEGAIGDGGRALACSPPAP